MIKIIKLSYFQACFLIFKTSIPFEAPLEVYWDPPGWESVPGVYEKIDNKKNERSLSFCFFWEKNVGKHEQ